MDTHPAPSSDLGLSHGRLSNLAVLFQSVAQIAPAGGIATVAILGANFAGGALPLATVFSIVACLFVALAVSELARHLPSAGSLGTYVARAIGRGPGYVVGWMYGVSEMLIVSFVSLLIGALTSGLLNSEWGWPVKPVWIACVVIVYALVMVVHESGVTVTARVQLVISVVEVLFFLVLSIVLISHAGSANSLSVFGTGHSNVSGYEGAAGIFPAAVFIITAFGGFESASALAEEARHPRQAVRVAVVGAVLSIGLLYLLTSYAATVYFGPDKMGAFAAFDNGDPWTGMTKAVWGAGWVVLFLIIVNSLYGACQACMNVTTRMAFSMARLRIAPPWFGQLSRRHTPRNALLAASAFGLVLALALGLKYDPITGVSTIVVWSSSMYMALYILVSVACTAYYWRFQRSEFNWLRHLVLPVLGALAFVPVLLVQLGIPAFSFISKLSAPLTYGAYAAVAVVVLASIGAVYLSRTRPEALERFGVAFDEVSEALDDEARRPSGLGPDLPGGALGATE
jgi:amino acid transporter